MPTTAPTLPTIERIGQTAGEVWNLLAEQGPMAITKVISGVNEPRDVVLQALGWLAREDKITIDDNSRSRLVSLK